MWTWTSTGFWVMKLMELMPVEYFPPLLLLIIVFQRGFMRTWTSTRFQVMKSMELMLLSSIITGTWKMINKALMGMTVNISEAAVMTRMVVKIGKPFATRTKISKSSTMTMRMGTRDNAHSPTVTMSDTYCLPLPALVLTLWCQSW